MRKDPRIAVLRGDLRHSSFGEVSEQWIAEEIAKLDAVDPMRQPVSEEASLTALQTFVDTLRGVSRIDSMKLAIEAALAVMRGTPVEAKEDHVVSEDPRCAILRLFDHSELEIISILRGMDALDPMRRPMTKAPPDNFDPRFTTFLTALDDGYFSLWHALEAVKKRWLTKEDE